MNNRWRSIGELLLLLLLAGLVVVLLRDLIRQLLPPWFLYLGWLSLQYINGLPQQLLWALFVTLASLYSITRFLRGGGGERQPETTTRPFPGRVTVLRQWIRLLPAGNYYKWRLAQLVSHLTVEAIDRDGELTPDEILRRLGDGRLDVPRDVKAFLEFSLGARSIVHALERMSNGRSPLSTLLGRLLSGRRDPEVVTEESLEKMVTFIERTLEDAREP